MFMHNGNLADKAIHKSKKTWVFKVFIYLFRKSVTEREGKILPMPIHIIKASNGPSQARSWKLRTQTLERLSIAFARVLAGV